MHARPICITMDGGYWDDGRDGSGYGSGYGCGCGREFEWPLPLPPLTGPTILTLAIRMRTTRHRHRIDCSVSCAEAEGYMCGDIKSPLNATVLFNVSVSVSISRGPYASLNAMENVLDYVLETGAGRVGMTYRLGFEPHEKHMYKEARSFAKASTAAAAAF